MITVVTTAVTLSNSGFDWPGSDIRTGKSYMSSTLQAHFKDNGSQLSTHEWITLHIKYRMTHVFLSPYHYHLSHHDTKAVDQHVCCHSPVTICHNVLTLMCHQLHCTHYRPTCCGNLARHKDCNIRLHLAGAWLPILAWLNPCSCLHTAPQELWHMGKTALFLYQGCPPTNQTKS